MVYYERDPFGNERGDIHAAQISSIIAEVNRDRKRRSQPYTVKDFMPKYEMQRKPQQTVSQMKEIAKLITLGLGGKVG